MILPKSSCTRSSTVSLGPSLRVRKSTLRTVPTFQVADHLSVPFLFLICRWDWLVERSWVRKRLRDWWRFEFVQKDQALVNFQIPMISRASRTCRSVSLATAQLRNHPAYFPALCHRNWLLGGSWGNGREAARGFWTVHLCEKSRNEGYSHFLRWDSSITSSTAEIRSQSNPELVNDQTRTSVSMVKKAKSKIRIGYSSTWANFPFFRSFLCFVFPLILQGTSCRSSAEYQHSLAGRIYWHYLQNDRLVKSNWKKEETGKVVTQLAVYKDKVDGNNIILQSGIYFYIGRAFRSSFQNSTSEFVQNSQK